MVRIPIDGLRKDEFEVEQWCLSQAVKQGIPSPRVIGRGDVSGTPYIVLTYVEGSVVEGDLAAWETLGRYGRMAGVLEWTSGPDGLFTRFGRDPDDAWRRHLLYNAGQLTEADPLIGLGVYSASELPRLRALVSGLLDQDFGYGLRHGDLAPRNLLKTPSGSLVLLDWGQASVGPIPHGDLLDAYRSHVVDGQPTAPSSTPSRTPWVHRSARSEMSWTTCWSWRRLTECGGRWTTVQTGCPISREMLAQLCTSETSSSAAVRAHAHADVSVCLLGRF